MNGYYSDEAYRRSRDSGEKLLDKATEIAREYETEVTTAAATGKTSSTIVRYAEEHDIDHIVLGSHGRRGLARFLLGSVAERVARRAPGSVTIIRKQRLERESSSALEPPRSIPASSVERPTARDTDAVVTLTGVCDL